MVRSIAAVIGGYVVFAIPSVLLFQVAGVDPHGPSSLGFRGFGTVYGASFGFLAGYVTAAIAARHRMREAALVAGVMALAGVVSLIVQPGGDAIWTQVLSIVLFAPLVLLGARSRISGEGSRAERYGDR